MTESKPKFLLLKNYLAAIRAGAGSKMFRKLYFRINGRETEVLRNGDLSCAFFVSSVLKLFSLTKEIHTTVDGAVEDLLACGWRGAQKPKPGSIIVYKPKSFASGETHGHIGFYVGEGRAISNSSKTRSPKIHKWNCRPIEKILWRRKLEK